MPLTILCARLAQRGPCRGKTLQWTAWPCRKAASLPDAQAIDSATALLRMGLPAALESAHAVPVAGHLRQVWTTLKELDPTSTSVSDVPNVPLAVPSEVTLEGPRDLYNAVYHGLNRVVETGVGDDEPDEFVLDTLGALERRGDSLAYGEITFEGIASILARMRMHGFTPRQGSLVDIGAGIGNVAIAAALLEPEFQEVTGVEVLPGLHGVAKQAAERYERISNSERLPRLRFVLGDAAQVDWAVRDTPSLTIMHATGFSDELLQDLAAQAERLLPPGALIVAVTLRLPSAAFELIDRFEVPCSWGPATTLVLRRVGSQVVSDVGVEKTQSLASIVSSAHFGELVTGLVGAADNNVAREAAATVGFAARSERSARQLAELGAVLALTQVLSKGVDGSLGSPRVEVLVPLHAAAILAMRSFGAHMFSKQCFEKVGARQALNQLAVRGPSVGIRTAASMCLADVFDD